MPEVESISIYECAFVHISSNVDGLIEIQIYDKDSKKIGGNLNIGLYGPDNRMPDVTIRLQEHFNTPEFTYEFRPRPMTDEEFARAEEELARKADAKEGFE